MNSSSRVIPANNLYFAARMWLWQLSIKSPPMLFTCFTALAFSLSTFCINLQTSSPKIDQGRADSWIHILKHLGNVSAGLVTPWHSCSLLREINVVLLLPHSSPKAKVCPHLLTGGKWPVAFVHFCGGASSTPYFRLQCDLKSAR